MKASDFQPTEVVQGPGIKPGKTVYLVYGLEVGNKEVRVIVGPLVLKYRDNALQAHACIDVFCR